jgi:hypothetical protein
MSRFPAVGVLAAALIAAPAVAAPFDHLQCYKIKPDRRIAGAVDLTPAQAELLPTRDCRVRGPVLFCAPVMKTVTRVVPPAPGAPPGGEETDHLCYKVRCPKPLPAPLVVSDQFGTFTLRFMSTTLLCTPAIKGTPTTTTVSSTTTTTEPAACHTCWLTVSDLCTATPCRSDADCTYEPNLLCRPDKCPIACP